MSLPQIGNSFIYIEISSGDSDSDNVFCSSEWLDNIQITNKTFYYNKFSVLNNDSLTSLGRFRIHFLLIDNTSSTRYNIPKNDG